MAGKITKLEVQKKNKERVSVYIDDQFALGVPLATAMRLRKGQTLSEADIEELRREDGVQKAYDRALNYLSFRPRSEREIRDYLRRKDVADDVIDHIVGRLRNIGLVDDEVFAQMWVSHRQATGPRGARALRMELRQKGVDRMAVDEALTGLDEAGQALEAGRTRATRLVGLEAQDFRKKLTDYLLRRGFDYGVVRDTVKTVWAEQTSERMEMEEDE